MMTIAETILGQLGGRRFATMTGAKDFIGSADALSFRLPARFAKQGITAIRVELQADDTYRVRFFRWNRTELREVATADDVYAEDLQRIFSRETGLDTHL